MAPGGGVSGSANFASGKQRGDYKSVVEQSGFIAGQQGYAVKVKGETALTGGVIASAAAAEKNRFETGTLQVSDIQNSESWKASSTSLGAGYGPGVARDKDGKTVSTGAGAPVAGSGPGKFSATAPVAMNAKGKQDGETLSAIAPGSIIITSGDAASQQAAATVSRDTSAANAGALTRQFDDAKRAEIGQGFEATKALTSETVTFFANRATEEAKAKTEKEDPQKYSELIAATGGNRQLATVLTTLTTLKKDDPLTYTLTGGGIPEKYWLAYGQGAGQQLVSDAKGMKDALVNYQQSYDKLKSFVEYAAQNPGAVASGAYQAAKAHLDRMDNASMVLRAAEIVKDPVTATAMARELGRP